MSATVYGAGTDVVPLPAQAIVTRTARASSTERATIGPLRGSERGEGEITMRAGSRTAPPDLDTSSPFPCIYSNGHES